MNRILSRSYFKSVNYVATANSHMSQNLRYTNIKFSLLCSAPVGAAAANFHTSSSRFINPLILAVIRPLSKVAAMLIGRGFRRWWQSLPKDKRDLVIAHFRRQKWKYLVSFSTCGGASYFIYNTHVTVTPYTNRRRFMIFDSSQITKIADFSFKSDLAEYMEHILPQHHPKVLRVKQICQRLLRGNRYISQIYSKFWTISVIDLPEENCHVYPSGQIVIFSGMLDLTDNDDQLAVVLSHEMSHVVLEHNAELLSYGSLVDILLLIPLAVIWACLPNDGIAAVTHWFFNKVVDTFINLPYSRTLEAEADSLGLHLAASACFDVREASAFWGHMDVLEKARAVKTGAPDPIKFLSTHPSHSDRQNHLDVLMKSALETRDAQQCPKLGKIDPRMSVRILQESLKESSASAVLPSHS